MRPIAMLAASVSILFAAGAAATLAAPQSDALNAAVKAPTRSAVNAARDRYRHPAQTLAFFGVKPSDTVVELYPGGGWYTEIVAPYLAQRGTLYVAAPAPNGLKGVRTLQARDPSTYRTVKLAAFPGSEGTDAPATVPDGSADVVLTFRNIHNWRFGGADQTQAAFDAAFRMLKPGGTFGVVEHRLPEDRDSALEEKSGYMKVSSVIGFARKAGFTVDAQSEVNANPKDTADWPEGVWTLPPSLRLKDVDRAKYQAIGESDRMTIRFRKPG